MIQNGEVPRSTKTQRSLVYDELAVNFYSGDILLHIPASTHDFRVSPVFFMIEVYAPVTVTPAIPIRPMVAKIGNAIVRPILR